MISEDILKLAELFEEKRDDYQAERMKAYMKGQFEYYGLPSPVRREVQKKFLDTYGKPRIEDLEDVLLNLWDYDEREFQYFGIDLYKKMVKKCPKEMIHTTTALITKKSWWDTVDLLASSIVGTLLLRFPEEEDKVIEAYTYHDDKWLNRTAIIYQLKYKDQLDTKRLASIIEVHKYSTDFFIKKAIGWMLRQYSRTNPEWVINFVNSTDIHPFSKKEALRLLK